MSIKQSIRLIKVDVEGNNNKFWNGDLYEDGHYEANWGRVGARGQSGSYQGESKFNSKIRSKKKDGYVEQKTIQEDTVVEVKQGDLKDITKTQIQTDSPVLDKLLDRLIKANIHQITSNTNIKFDAGTGVFQTPLGIVTLEGIKEASAILDELYDHLKNKGDGFYTQVNEYLKIVPQKVGRNVKEFIDSTFSSADDIRKQKDLLDSLEVSFNTFKSATKDTTTSSDDVKVEQEKVFDVDIEVLEDKKEYKRLEDNFYATKKSMHNYSNVKVKQIYTVKLGEMDRNFDKEKWGNVQEFYHGTGIANCLSIMKSGLKTAPPSSAHIAGKMFGNGIYGANCASKSLGYSLGRWGQGRSNDGAWLFVCDFAMGKEDFVRTTCRKPKSGCDSVSALARNTSLYNDEFIVYKNAQVNIKYLIECSS